MVCIHHIYANDINIGDALSAWGIRTALSPLLPDCSWQNYHCDAPLVVDSLSRLDRQMKPKDIIIIGGGGLLIKYFETLWQWVLDHLPKHVSLVMWGIGTCVNKHISLLPRQTVQSIIKRAALCTVRDDLTAQICGRNLNVVHCPAHLIARHQVATADQSIPESTITYAWHPDLVNRSDLNDVLAAFRRFNPHQTVSTIRNTLEGTDPLVYINQHYAEASCVITSRLHGAIIGNSCGKPVLIHVKDQKIAAYAKLCKIEASCFTNIDELPRALHNIKPVPKSTIDQIVDGNLDFAHQVADHVSASFP